jgi:ectoine hydroxylase-related dioxygenase (phytanoyl-CoA dioxygenase family)
MAAEVTNPLPGVPLVESPFFERLFPPAGTDPALLAVARQLHRDGFAVIDFPDPDFDRRAAAIRAGLHDRFDWAAWRELGKAGRMQDLWRDDAEVRALAANAAVLDLLSRLYGRRAWPFQTLTFPVGSQQPYHSDAVHFSSAPERFLCGVWVALEDVDEGNGPLVYYPGSHRWPILGLDQLGRDRVEGRPSQLAFHAAWQALVAQHGLEPKRFHARRGQALIWAANLLHGGELHRDRARSRWSQVTHYYFDDCLYYTPMGSLPLGGQVQYRTPLDIATGRPVPGSLNGRPLDRDFREGALAGDWRPLRVLRRALAWRLGRGGKPAAPAED